MFVESEWMLEEWVEGNDDPKSRSPFPEAHCCFFATRVMLSKKGNFTLVIQVTPRSCSGHALIIRSQTKSQQDCECHKFNNDMSNDQIVVDK